MRQPDWGVTLRGILLRWTLQTLVAAAVLAGVGLWLGGWIGARNGGVFGLLAGGLAFPFVLDAIVDARGGGIERSGHEAFYAMWYGDALPGRDD